MAGRRPRPTRLVLVRHGESQVTVDGVVGGPKTCSGLSGHGRRQVEALAERWAATGEVRADILLSSNLPRAVETARLLSPALGGIEVEQVEDLGERLPGICDGMTWDEYRSEYRGDGWVFSIYEPLSPGGESFAQFQVRAAAALHQVATALSGRTVVIACHGGIIETSMIAFLGITPTLASGTMRQPNASVTEWALDPTAPPTGGALPWRLVRYNDAAHLHGVVRSDES